MDKLIDFFSAVEKLKRVKRTGWVREGVPDAESVADHSFGTAFLSVLLADKLKVPDKEKLIKMALIHDLAEAEASDIVTVRGIKKVSSEKDKFEKEKKAMTKLFANIDKKEEFINTWLEYESQVTAEAKIVKQLDKLEMAFQALEYENDIDPSKLDEFFINTKINLKEPFLIELFNELEKRRKKK